MDKARVKVEVIEKGRLLRQTVFEEFPVLFGRGSECHLRLDEYVFLSRVHGSISVERNQIIVTDLGSKNGLTQDGKRFKSLRCESMTTFSVLGLQVRLFLEGEDEASGEETAITVLKLEDDVDGAPIEGVHFTVAPIPDLSKVPVAKLTVQAVITWFDGIYDVRNYVRGDRLVLGPHPTEPIYIPTMLKRTDFGVYGPRGAALKMSGKAQWRLFRQKKQLSVEEMVAAKSLIREGQGNDLVTLGINDVLSIDLGEGLAVHFRYVETPRFSVPRTLIENREEFKKAILTSGILHLSLSLAALAGAPKYDAPKIENVPPRIAKLIVQPPVQVFASKPEPTPPPPPPPAPEPEPEPKSEPLPVAEKKAVPKPAPKPEAKEKPKPIARAQVERKKPSPAKASSARSEPSSQPDEQQALASLLSALPAAPGGMPGSGAPIKISKSQISSQGIKVGGLASVAANAKSNSPAGLGDDAFKVGGVGAQSYSKEGAGGKAGKRGVGGRVVGAPDFSPELSRAQGLSNEQVMNEVNKHLSGVQRCYERALFEDPSISGRVEYEWEISAQGKVTEARVARSEVARGDSLNNCVLALFRKMRFPVAKNGQTTIAKIGFPFGKK